jgi:hypothetical protein
MAANRTISARSADPFAINAKGKDEKVLMDAFTIRAGALRGGWPHPAKPIVRRSFCLDQACHSPISDHSAIVRQRTVRRVQRAD